MTEEVKKKRGRKKKSLTEKIDAEKVTPEPSADEKLIAAVREQVEAATLELRLTLEDTIRHEVKATFGTQLKKANRRRVWNNFFRDVVIVAFAVVAGYFGYCLYDVHYFNFMKTDCEKAGTCEQDDTVVENITQSAGPIKDEAWYLSNYQYLFDSLKLNSNADNISAYYLYSDDHKAAELKSDVQLAMAFNQVTMNSDFDITEVTVTEEDMHEAFRKTFGDTVDFPMEDFSYGCLNFKYDKKTHVFAAENKICEQNVTREIIEKIEKIYEEGEVVYVLTKAGVYDKTSESFYNFNNLFAPIMANVPKSDFDIYAASMNRYQYQFKKIENGYVFSGVVKLK